MARTEREMAELFLEINDKQRRVPSSLRWDLVRLVRRGDVDQVMTSDIIFELVTRKDSPFESVSPAEPPVRIDMTGEDQRLIEDTRGTWIKQGSLAPEIRTLLKRTRQKHGDALDGYVELLIRFFAAVKSLDTSGWERGSSPFLKARVVRALIRVLTELVAQRSTLDGMTAQFLRAKFAKIDKAKLSPEYVRTVQGSAGVHDLYIELRRQIGMAASS
jgi:hypothetical protein